MASLSEKAQSGAALEGEILHDHYHIQTQIAKGGMAWIFRANNTLLDEPVALKVLYPQFSEETEVRQRFFGEAKIQFRLKHAHIIQVLDVLHEGHLCAMVMEWVDGIDLGDHLKQQKRALSLKEIWRLTRPLLDALHFAHEHGVVHRDLKPSNILLHQMGTTLVPKLCDFGIAKVAGTLGGHKLLTVPGSMLGTPSYMSPEQIQTPEKVDRRADIYSFGILLYKMVTGRTPFRGQTPINTLRRHLNQPPTPPNKLNPKIPPALNQLIMRCLEKEPQRRFETCQELAFALTSALDESAPDQPRTATQLEAAEQIMSARLQLRQTPPGSPSTDGKELASRDGKVLDQAPYSDDPEDRPGGLPTGIEAPPEETPTPTSSEISLSLADETLSPPRSRSIAVPALSVLCVLLLGVVGVLLWKQRTLPQPPQAIKRPTKQRVVAKARPAKPSCVPQKESCNGKDDDCDGKIDNGVKRACQTRCGPGTTTCHRGKWDNCLPTNPPVETCNGKDDNCDGRVDEADPKQGRPCQQRWGQCTLRGKLACHPKKHILYCALAEPVARPGHSKLVLRLSPPKVSFSLRLGQNKLTAKGRTCLSLKRHTRLEVTASGYQRCFVTLKKNQGTSRLWLKPSGSAPPFASYCLKR